MSLQKVVCCHEPTYLPWIGFWQKVFQSDVLVLLDDIQYSKNNYTNRVLIRGTHGEPQWLTVPVRTRGRRLQAIRDVEIVRDGWDNKHRRTLQACYGKAPFYRPLAYGLLKRSRLADLNTGLIIHMAECMGLSLEIVRSSNLGEPLRDSPNERLVDAVQAVGGSTYLSGSGAKDYLNPFVFQQAGLDLRCSRFTSWPYDQQQWEWLPGLGILDALYNIGMASTVQMLKLSSSSTPWGQEWTSRIESRA